MYKTAMELYVDYDDDVYETPNKVKSAHALLFEDEGTYQT
jgi:hypothetical protein